MKFKQWIQSQFLKENKIKHFIDSHGLILFFKKGSEYFGTSEDGRIVFAKLKNPDDEETDGWEDEANFSAVNISKVGTNQISQQVFTKKDLKKMKIVDEKEVLDKVKSQDNVPSASTSFTIIKLPARRDDE